jgi:hypothetical protein
MMFFIMPPMPDHAAPRRGRLPMHEAPICATCDAAPHELGINSDTKVSNTLFHAVIIQTEHNGTEPEHRRPCVRLRNNNTIKFALHPRQILPISGHGLN